nr:uncharacterized protein LOC129383955 [Dermacentor andersoni]
MEFLRWLGASVLRALLHWIRFALSSPIFLFLVPMLLGLTFRWLCFGKGGRSEKTRIPSALPRCLTRPTSVEDEARFTLARRRRRYLRGTRHGIGPCFTRSKKRPCATGDASV